MNINQSLGYLLNTSARNIKSLLNDELKSAGITTSQWAVLKLLSEKGMLTQVDIALNLKSDKATVGAITEKIERKGLVIKDKNLLDKRAYNVFLTDAGESLVNNLVGAAENVNSVAFRGFNQKQRKDLEQYLNRVTLNLEDMGENKNELDK